MKLAWLVGWWTCGLITRAGMMGWVSGVNSVGLRSVSRKGWLGSGAAEDGCSRRCCQQGISDMGCFIVRTNRSHSASHFWL